MRCPVCRAEVDPRPQCRRCRADLSLLVALEDQRQSALRQAHQALATGDGPRLLAAASRAHLLRRDEESARLVALAYLLCRDFASGSPLNVGSGIRRWGRVVPARSRRCRRLPTWPKPS